MHISGMKARYLMQVVALISLAETRNSYSTYTLDLGLSKIKR